MGQASPRSTRRSVTVKTCGAINGSAVPGVKKGLSRYLPLRREPNTLRMILSDARNVDHGVEFTVPLADVVLMAALAGPNAAVDLLVGRSGSARGSPFAHDSAEGAPVDSTPRGREFILST